MRDLKHELDTLGEDERPPSWPGEVGDVFVGTFIRYERAETRYGIHFIAVAQEEKTQEPVSVWLSWKVLQEKFRELRPQAGERIGIRRLPDAEKGYRRFAMLVDRGGSNEPDFFNQEEGVQDAPDLPTDITEEDPSF